MLVLAPVGSDGSFSGSVTPTETGTWKALAHWQGDQTSAPADSAECSSQIKPPPAPPPPPPPPPPTTTTTTTTPTTPALNPQLSAKPSGKGYDINGSGWDTCGNPVVLDDNGASLGKATPDASGTFSFSTSSVKPGDTITGVQDKCDKTGQISAKTTAS
jgi:hypothetical protein